jgi:hypothetical protein
MINLKYFFISVYNSIGFIHSKKLFKVSFHSTFGFNRLLFLDKPLEVFIDIIPSKKKRYNRILVLLEPNGISEIRNKVLNLKDSDFDLILTHDPIILKSISKSKLLPFGTTWVHNFQFKNKEFGVSTLIGGKKITPLHRLRHQLVELLDLNFDINLFFFNSINESFNYSGNKLMNISAKESKNELFFCQFHIAIENVISENYFSEKLIDCFQSKTVPIYLGCPNISEFFDIGGIILVNNFTDIIEVLKDLKSDSYDKMLDSINNNFDLSKKYLDFESRLENELQIFASF